MNLLADLKTFKPALSFLGKFIGLYLVGNLLYGMYVTAYRPSPDPVTRWVTNQTAAVLRWTGEDVDVTDDKARPNSIIHKGNEGIISVYEGCNGINTVMIFAAFVVSFGPLGRSAAWYIPAGILAIHLLNILRLYGLALITMYQQEYLYFFHKYFFTAFIYAFILLFWMIWVKYIALRVPDVKNNVA